jgi:putative oxidoreductase
VSIDDDRPRHAGDYANSGTYTRGTGSYAGGGSTESSWADDDAFSSEPTTVLPGSSPYDGFADEAPAGPRNGWHAGADLGLLVLRLVLGGLFIAHALQHLFGWLQGRGLDGMADQLARFGYSNNTILAWVTGLTELVGGTFVLLGLFTPAGAAAILALMANAIVVKFNVDVFAGGVELESIYAAAAFAILFAGPGRISLDRPTPWYRNASAFGVVFFLLAAAASVTMLLVFR